MGTLWLYSLLIRVTEVSGAGLTLAALHLSGFGEVGVLNKVILVLEVPQEGIGHSSNPLSMKGSGLARFAGSILGRRLEHGRDLCVLGEKSVVQEVVRDDQTRTVFGQLDQSSVLSELTSC